MKKKFVSALFAVCLCVALCACDSGSESDRQAPAQVQPVASRSVDRTTQDKADSAQTRLNESIQEESEGVNAGLE